jgi:hypothetical protein
VVNPDQTTVLDTLRVLDYPNDYVPVIREKVITTGMAQPAEPTEPPTAATPATPPPEASPQPTLRVINKATLNAQLAKNYIDDVLTSLGLRFPNLT